MSVTTKFSKCFPADSVVFREGEPGDYAYIIERGTVRISALIGGKEVVLGIIGEGDVFGEMALIDESIRSATATAMEPVKLIQVDRDHLGMGMNPQCSILQLFLKVILSRYWEMRGFLESATVGQAKNDSSRRVNYKKESSISTRRLKLEDTLLESIQNNRFVLDFQPLICLDDNRVHGFEALVRWNHPIFGLIAPGEFIALAEETSLITPLGYWIIDAAFQQKRTLDTLGGSMAVININLSPRQFDDPSFIKRIGSRLEDSGIEPNEIVFEITESMLITEPLLANKRLRALKELGFLIALDDFGTGYSSLSYLHRFPIDILKIDRSFIVNLDSNKRSELIALSIIYLAKSLGIKLTAEGIENRTQMEFLRQNGVDFGQGYWFSKPMRATDIAEWTQRFQSDGGEYPSPK